MFARLRTWFRRVRCLAGALDVPPRRTAIRRGSPHLARQCTEAQEGAVILSDAATAQQAERASTWTTAESHPAATPSTPAAANATASHSSREWLIQPPHPNRERLANEARIHPLLAQLLLNRGIETAGGIRPFLFPEFRMLLPPDSLPGATACAERLAEAARAGRRIVIYGDYDVDGVAATAILWHALKLAGANVDYYIPSRLEEGYGMNADALARIAADGGGLVVTVDCGITAARECDRARELGLEVIVTDHHEPGASLPDALIVHPRLGTAAGGGPFNPDLSGAGVALKLAWALGQKLHGAARVSEDFRETLLDATALAALGLIADVVPLTGENRIIASFGLRHLRRTKNAGLNALIDAAGLREKVQSGRDLDDYDVGFALAPRLNAVGRMGHARLAVEMFTRAGPQQARTIAETLNAHNRQRQAVERTIVKQAEEMVRLRGFDRDGCHGIVLGSPDWHPGVIGIVAARLVERFCRPTVLVALENGAGQGSGRSVRHFPLHEVLARCSAHLISFGGHAMAAGVRLHSASLDAFTEAFLHEAGQRLSPRHLRPSLELDDEVGLNDLQSEVVEQFERMAPFGTDNPRPRLATTPVQLVEAPRTVGANGQHLQFTVRQESAYRKAVAFNKAAAWAALADHRSVRLAFEPIINDWNGRRRVELKVLDWKPA